MPSSTVSEPVTDPHAILPVDMHRLAELFEFLGAEYALINKDESDALVLQTGLPHITIHIDLDDDTLSAFATWEGRAAAAEEDEVAAVVGDLNWELVAPTLSYSFGEDARGTEEIVICANRAMGVGEGLSRNQLGMFIASAFDSFGAAFDALADALPQAVTWSDEEDAS